MGFGFFTILCVLLLAFTSLCSCKYTFCVIPRTARYHAAEKYCNILLNAGSEITCVFGTDRLDCLRKMSTGASDFAVLQAEELIIASYSRNVDDILLAYQIRQHTQHDWEYGVIAVVDNSANISGLKDLQGKRLCHPGYDPSGFQYDWSEIFSEYFESRVVTQQCDRRKTVAENRIKSLAEFFGDTCKPGSWVTAHHLDSSLKSKYKSLCSLCELPGQCSSNDKYWGRQGALFCLSDCLGDVAWSRLDDALYHFKTGTLACNDVSILCRDGSIMPLNSSSPCIWVARPNPVVAVNRQRAEKIQFALWKSLETSDVNAKVALHTLLESNGTPQRLSLVTSDDYLSQIPGYLNSNTVVRCGQGNRSVRLCSTTKESQAKCAWMAAAANAYGVEPSILCMQEENCMLSVSKNSSDVVIISTDQYVPSVRDYKLKSVLVQTRRNANEVNYISAVVKSDSEIHTLSDLKGKRACFTSVDGVGWSSLIMVLKKFDLIPPVCPHDVALATFFSDICVIRGHDEKMHNITNIRTCNVQDTVQSRRYEPENDEDVALECLLTGGGDVTFISLDTVQKYQDTFQGAVSPYSVLRLTEEGETAPRNISVTNKISLPRCYCVAITLFDKLHNTNAWSSETSDVRSLCDSNTTQSCFLQWSSLGQVMIHPETSEVKTADIIELFTHMDVLFGSYNTVASYYSFRAYSKFEQYHNLLFQDDTERLELTEHFITKAKARSKNYEIDVSSVLECSVSASSRNIFPSLYFVTFTFCIYFSRSI